MSASEITICVKDDEKRLSKKHLSYEEYKVDEHDPFIASLIDEAVKEFNAEPIDITVKIKLTVK